jgi:hypothetical protein
MGATAALVSGTTMRACVGGANKRVGDGTGTGPWLVRAYNQALSHCITCKMVPRSRGSDKCKQCQARGLLQHVVQAPRAYRLRPTGLLAALSPLHWRLLLHHHTLSGLCVCYERALKSAGERSTHGGGRCGDLRETACTGDCGSSTTSNQWRFGGGGYPLLVNC